MDHGCQAMCYHALKLKSNATCQNLLKNINIIFFILTGQNLIQRCVIVQRDEKGYGLTVTGDNPVYVQSVKDGMFKLVLAWCTKV